MEGGGIMMEASIYLMISFVDYGDKHNQDLAKQFEVLKEDFPVYKMFKQSIGLDKPVKFEGDITSADEIIQFIVKETGKEYCIRLANFRSYFVRFYMLLYNSLLGLWMGLPACLKEFHVLVQEFLSSDDDSKRNEILITAHAKMDEIESDEDKKTRAVVYVKTMEKVLEKGIGFIHTEMVRVNKLMEGKLSDKKMKQLKDRLSILTSFSMYRRDEL